MIGRVWTSGVSLAFDQLNPNLFTTTVAELPKGSPVLCSLFMSEQPSASAFVQAFLCGVRTHWTSQDQPLVSYGGANDAGASSSPYTLPYHTIAQCTRFSSFVQHELGETTRVNPIQLTNALLTELARSIVGPSGMPTNAGLQLWTQFATSNVHDKVTMVVANVLVWDDTVIIPKCDADIGHDQQYTGAFGIEIVHV
jgi:hypothetical protein